MMGAGRLEVRCSDCGESTRNPEHTHGWWYSLGRDCWEHRHEDGWHPAGWYAR